MANALKIKLEEHFNHLDKHLGYKGKEQFWICNSTR